VNQFFGGQPAANAPRNLASLLEANFAVGHRLMLVVAEVCTLMFAGVEGGEV
jgi:hypothetical protein